MAQVKQFKIGENIFDVVSVSATTAEKSAYADIAGVANVVKGIGVNAKGNLEITNRRDSTLENKYETTLQGDKVNIVSMGAIQLKTGITSKGKSAAIALDNEFNTASPNEIEVQTCNGAKRESDGEDKFVNDIMGLKLNTAEIVIDNKKAYTGGVYDNSGKEIEGFDPNSIQLKVRTDTWNGGISSNNKGPIPFKVKARSIDLRCYDHGGIAIQIAGQDSSGHENKIKFESDRTALETQTYCGEGGKGVEFGTFNTEHSSLYTNDYRFNKDGEVYAVTRGELEANETGKIDYPTQPDDFKDIITVSTPHATWEEIISVARDYADGSLTADAPPVIISGETGEIDLSVYATVAQLESVEGNVTTALSNSSTALNKSTTNETKIESISAKLTPVSVTSKGNFQIDVAKTFRYEDANGKEIFSETYSGVTVDGVVYIYKGVLTELVFPTAVKNDAYEIGIDGTIDTLEVITGDLICYNKSGWFKVEKDTYTVETLTSTVDYANINFETSDTIKCEAGEAIELNAPLITNIAKITAKGKVSIGGVSITGLTTADEMIEAIRNNTQIGVTIENGFVDGTPSIGEVTEEELNKIRSISTVNVSLYDLVKLIDRVTALEEAVRELQGI